ncbi:hypothetical protein ACF0H5_000868 [Mactra antiquata]
MWRRNKSSSRYLQLNISTTDVLMGEEILNCDVTFGLGEPDSVFPFKQSPSHQSDSGCSDMSEDRSVSPLSNSGFLSPVDRNLFNFDAINNVEELDEFSQELESYLASPIKKVTNIHAKLQTPELPMCDTNVHKENYASSPEINVDDEEEPDYLPQPRVIQAKARVGKNVMVSKQPVPSLIRVPATNMVNGSGPSVSSNVNDKMNKVPAIKVVKVVKTSAKSKKEFDDDILEALDERNKKNAVQAKINRERKKLYIKGLEDEIEELKSENVSLKEIASKAEAEKQELAEEVAYLKSVLANQSAISGLLKNIGNVENVKLSSSIMRKRGASDDHSYGSAKRSRSSTHTAGVCLHVDKGNVSLEFCSKCASMAKCNEKV